jgi:hypothetical protein
MGLLAPMRIGQAIKPALYPATKSNESGDFLVLAKD